MNVLPIFSRSIKLTRYVSLFSLTALLSACQPTADVESNLKFAPPSSILQVRAINRDLLEPSVVLSNGTQIPMTSNGDNTWSGTIIVQPNNSYFVSVEWIEALPEGDLVLARWAQDIPVGAEGAQINIANENYDLTADLDGDTISNLIERQNDTNPFVPNDEVIGASDGETDGSIISGGTSSGDTGTSAGSDGSATTSAGNTDDGILAGEGTAGSDGTTSGDTIMGASDVSIGVGTSSDGTTDSDIISGGTTSGSSDTGGSDGLTTAGTASGGSTTSGTDGDSVTVPAKASVLIPRIPPADAPTIDGLGVTQNAQNNLTGEWSSAVQIDDSGARLWIKNLMIDQGADGSDGDELHRWAAMHDGTNLYVLVLTDDIGTGEADSVDYWQDDSIELFIDGDNSKLTEWGDVNDYHMIVPLLKQFSTVANDELSGRFAPGPASTTLDIEFSTGPGEGPDGRTNWEHDVYEIVVPLTAAGIEVGSEFGLEIQLNDDDGGGFRDSKWGWFHPSRVNDEDTDLTYLDPSIMGTVILEE